MVHITALGAFRPHADSASSGRTRTTTLTASSCPLGGGAADDRSNSSIIDYEWPAGTRSARRPTPQTDPHKLLLLLLGSSRRFWTSSGRAK